LEVVSHGVDDLFHFLPRIIVGWVNPFGHCLNIVSVALIKNRGILLFRIEGMFFDREIFPPSLLKYRPPELHQTRVDSGFRSWSEKISPVQLLNFGRDSGFPSLKGMDMAPI
jgi:hypothetical protein